VVGAFAVPLLLNALDDLDTQGRRPLCDKPALLVPAELRVKLEATSVPGSIKLSERRTLDEQVVLRGIGIRPDVGVNQLFGAVVHPVLVVVALRTISRQLTRCAPECLMQF
jgi:hypothetical protein